MTQTEQGPRVREKLEVAVRKATRSDRPTERRARARSTATRS
jgi:hypothetical protein